MGIILNQSQLKALNELFKDLSVNLQNQMQGILLKNDESEICHLKVTCFKNHQQQPKIRLNSHLLWEPNNPYQLDTREKIRIKRT